MDLSTIIGTIVAFGLVFMAMAGGGGGIMLFYDFPSVLIVFGGTIGVTMMNFTLGDLKGLTKVILRSYLFKLNTPAQEIERIIDYANVARREGLLALEGKLKEVNDPFFAKGIQLVIDGFAADTVRDVIALDADWQRQRHSAGKKILDQIGLYAPAFGMLGTLIGLVQMLQNLSDPSQIGGGMAVALLTTLYGAVIANMLTGPLAGKLDLRAKEEALLRDLMVEGIIAIQSGEKPQLIKEKLKSFLAPSAREGV